LPVRIEAGVSEWLFSMHTGPRELTLAGLDGGIVRFALYGLIFALLLFAVSGGHLIFLPLFFVLPLGGLLGHRRRYGGR
jgi:hypothetical protein